MCSAIFKTMELKDCSLCMTWALEYDQNGCRIVNHFFFPGFLFVSLFHGFCLFCFVLIMRVTFKGEKLS